jgi:hypothetical protein
MIRIKLISRLFLIVRYPKYMVVYLMVDLPVTLFWTRTCIFLEDNLRYRRFTKHINTKVCTCSKFCIVTFVLKDCVSRAGAPFIFRSNTNILKHLSIGWGFWNQDAWVVSRLLKNMHVQANKAGNNLHRCILKFREFSNQRLDRGEGIEKRQVGCGFVVFITLVEILEFFVSCCGFAKPCGTNISIQYWSECYFSDYFWISSHHYTVASNFLVALPAV